MIYSTKVRTNLSAIQNERILVLRHDYFGDPMRICADIPVTIQLEIMLINEHRALTAVYFVVVVVVHIDVCINVIQTFTCDEINSVSADYNLTFTLHLSLNRGSRWSTTDDFTTTFLHFSLFSTALWDLADFRPVHSLMMSSHLFFCLSRLLPH